MVRAPEDLLVGYLEQEPLARSGETLGELFARRTGVAAALAEAEAVARTMGEDLTAIQRYTDALARADVLGAYDLDARAAQACVRLGVPDDLDRRVATLSGGQRARAALATLSIVRFDVLLLDEPTNDLDLDGLDVLEGIVRHFDGGIVAVSHDRAFLDGTVDRVRRAGSVHARGVDVRRHVAGLRTGESASGATNNARPTSARAPNELGCWHRRARSSTRRHTASRRSAGAASRRTRSCSPRPSARRDAAPRRSRCEPAPSASRSSRSRETRGASRWI